MPASDAIALTKDQPARPRVGRGYKPTIHLLATNDLDRTITFAIDGARWEYWLHPQDFESVGYIARRWLAKGFAHAKRRAYRAECLSERKVHG